MNPVIIRVVWVLEYIRKRYPEVQAFLLSENGGWIEIFEDRGGFEKGRLLGTVQG